MTLHHGTRHTGSISKTKSLKEIALPNTLLSYTIDTKTTSIFSEKISPANDGLFVLDGLFVHEGLYVYVQLTYTFQENCDR